MNRKYPENVDPAPKRRKDKDNPYEIFSVGINTDFPRFFVRFTDAVGAKRCLEISKTLYDQLNRFELDDLSFLNEVDNHYEHSELTEASLHTRAFLYEDSVEEVVMSNLQNEELYRAISELPEIQHRRLLLYFFDGYTYEQIAAMEGCSKVAVKYSVDNAIATLRKKLQNL